jgi:nucleoside-diphosphate-sugar epimerase
VRSFIETGLAGGPITVWGRGERRNQYTYVMDIVDALANLLDRRDVARQRTFNIVSPTVTTTADLATLIARSLRCEVRFLTDRPEGPSLAFIDSTFSRQTLGWHVTGLEDGVAATLATMRRLQPA